MGHTLHLAGGAMGFWGHEIGQWTLLVFFALWYYERYTMVLFLSAAVSPFPHNLDCFLSYFKIHTRNMYKNAKSVGAILVWLLLFEMSNLKIKWILKFIPVCCFSSSQNVPISALISYYLKWWKFLTQIKVGFSELTLIYLICVLYIHGVTRIMFEFPIQCC